jgi:hypothetical protein
VSSPLPVEISTEPREATRSGITGKGYSKTSTLNTEFQRRSSTSRELKGMTRMEVGTSTPKGRRMRPSRCKNHKLSWFDRLSSLAPHNYVLLYSLFHLWRDMPSRICIAFGSVSQISMALLRQARGQKFLAARWIATFAPVFLLVPISKATGHSPIDSRMQVASS